MVEVITGWGRFAKLLWDNSASQSELQCTVANLTTFWRTI